MTGNRAEGVSADAVGDQPLARLSGGKIRANLAAETDDGEDARGRMIGRALHPPIMERLPLWDQGKIVR